MSTVAAKAKKSGLPSIEPGEYIFELTEKVEPRFKGAPPYPPKKSLPSRINAYDEQNDTVRALRAIPGVPEVWVDEQVEKRLNEQWAENNAWEPTFIDGKLILNAPEDNVKIIRLLMDDSYQEKKKKAKKGIPVVFSKISETAEAKNYMAVAREKKLASDRAFEAIAGGLRAFEAHARFLLIPMEEKGMPRSEEMIAADYIRYAETKPADFNKNFKSPLIEIQNQIVKAIQSGVIDTTTSRGEAIWKENGQKIASLDLTKKPVDSLVEFATSDEGKEFMERLNTLLK